MRFDNAGFSKVLTVSFLFNFSIIVTINMLRQSSSLKPQLTMFIQHTIHAIFNQKM